VKEGYKPTYIKVGGCVTFLETRPAGRVDCDGIAAEALYLQVTGVMALGAVRDGRQTDLFEAYFPFQMLDVIAVDAKLLQKVGKVNCTDWKVEMRFTRPAGISSDAKTTPRHQIHFWRGCSSDEKGLAESHGPVREEIPWSETNGRERLTRFPPQLWWSFPRPTHYLIIFKHQSSITQVPQVSHERLKGLRAGRNFYSLYSLYSCLGGHGLGVALRILSNHPFQKVPVDTPLPCVPNLELAM
jgi:hypothetical protein